MIKQLMYTNYLYYPLLRWESNYNFFCSLLIVIQIFQRTLTKNHVHLIVFLKGIKTNYLGKYKKVNNTIIYDFDDDIQIKKGTRKL